MSEVTVVITSFNRLDLLKETIETFNKTNTYPVKEIIIIDDSANPDAHRKIKEAYSKYNLILNEQNIGLVESIDKAYSKVTTPYIWHSEDDFNYFKPGFIERCLKIMESDSMICRVGIRGKAHAGMLSPDAITVDGVSYKKSLTVHGLWHGFGFQCGMIRKCHYDIVKPYTQYSTPQEFITIRECRIGLAYHALGLLAVSLTEDYATHTGGKRSTYGLKMDG